jgi:NitT/TauT family transport system permease protein
LAGPIARIAFVSAVEKADEAADSAPDAALRRLSPHHLVDYAIPALVLLVALAIWEATVRLRGIPPYILPAPSLIGATLVKDWPILSAALLVTLRTTVVALALAVIGSVALALLFAQSKWIERSFFPFAVVMQVTPIVAIAPLLLIYLTPQTAVLVCAFLVAFFPILSNTALGLASADHNLIELMELYRASRWQQMMRLRLPAALPFFLGGLRIGGGLALIGAIVAEIAAGSAGQGSGLAFRIVEAGFRLNIPRMFAALALISATGIAIYVFFSALSYTLLHRWHDSARTRG